MEKFVFSFAELDKTKLTIAGGKGANLAALSTIKAVNVPEGFCISTTAFKKVIGDEPLIAGLIAGLSSLSADDRKEISKIAHDIREAIESAAVPGQIKEEIFQLVEQSGDRQPYAVRSSATAEDLPTASFAGQQDSYLNIIGTDSILQHISKCWASLFTDRAIIYRIQNGFDHRKVRLAVLIQKMIFSDASGIMFTADPVTSNRKVISIDAGFGLGEALVSGLVNPDVYKVVDGNILDKKISVKNHAVYALKEGGTKGVQLNDEQSSKQVLSDEQILQLAQTGREVEKHFGHPQDIEWCLANDSFYIVQSRPVTTLYPVPETNDQQNHVYISVGHQQMMTDPMKPLGLSFYLLTTRAPMRIAGGRLFVDVAPMLSTASGRLTLIETLGKSDPLIRTALQAVVERDFISLHEEGGAPKNTNAPPPRDFNTQIPYDASLVPWLIKNAETAISESRANIQNKSGSGLFDFILEDLELLKNNIMAEPKSFAVIMTGMNASSWINEKMNEWLGEKNVADVLSQSVPNNVTSEMGLALLDLADIIRRFPKVLQYLQQAKDDDILSEMVKFQGGDQVARAFRDYLEKYGMRCVGEIDITRTRWSEKPAQLVPAILGNIKNFPVGEGKRRFEQGKREAAAKEAEILSRLKQLPDGEQKAEETKRMIHLIRNYSGFREYPKYAIISRYYLYKQALMKEADKLVQAKIVRERTDIYFLTFEELRHVVCSGKLDSGIIQKRREEYRMFEKLTPPRVMTSDGEVITGSYNRAHMPSGAIVGLPVSSGLVEGRARVILRMEDADLEEGDILVTPFTDPSWTPLFVSIKGLVTEVGGLMTHGAVIAREYGIPAVVGVENATKLINDKQRIRVHGTEGYVEVLG